MKCPKCGSIDCKIVSETKESGRDYSICDGFLGELCLGPSGFICGMTNDRDVDVQTFWVCRKCGCKFKS
ncbi:MAG: hypothetical protein ACI4L2_03290 [Wujia sp.]